MRPVSVSIIFLLLVVQTAGAQSTRSLINEGNDLYEAGKYSEAEINYRKALEKEAQSIEGRFNLGNALHKQRKYQESVNEFESAAVGAEERKTRAGSYYNRGNSFLEEQEFDKAIASYIESLKLDPSDEDAKYNLSYARRRLKQQQQQQNKGGQNQDKREDQQQKKDDQDQNKNEQKNDPEKQQQKPEAGQPPPQANQQRPMEQMSKADAERILEVLKNAEKDLQKKLRAKPKARAKTEKDW